MPVFAKIMSFYIVTTHDDQLFIFWIQIRDLITLQSLLAYLTWNEYDLQYVKMHL